MENRMAINTRMLVTLALSGWAAYKMTRSIRNHSQKQEHTQQKAQLQTWEGEGGNLPGVSSVNLPVEMPDSKPSTH
jgi:hypothetical protein